MIVTTHSPIILNYIPDKIARDAVVFLYKTRTGQTKAVRFFDYPRMAAKLRALGPGEVYVDTRLTDLVHELEQTLP